MRHSKWQRRKVEANGEHEVNPGEKQYGSLSTVQFARCIQQKLSIWSGNTQTFDVGLASVSPKDPHIACW